MNFGLQVSQLSVGELRPTGGIPWDTQLIFTAGELRPTGITTHCRWTWAYRTSRANGKAADEHPTEHHATRLNSLFLYSSLYISLLCSGFSFLCISLLCFNYSVLCTSFLFSDYSFHLYLYYSFSLYLFTLLWLLCFLCFSTLLWFLCLMYVFKAYVNFGMNS